MFDISFTQIESFAKVVTTLFGLGLAGYKAYQTWMELRVRANIKRDIELIKSLELAKLAKSAKTVKASVNRTIKAHYSPRKSILKRLLTYKRLKQGASVLGDRVLGFIPKPVDLIMFWGGLIMSVVFLPLFALINTDAETQKFNWSWWSVIPGLIGFFGACSVIVSFDKEAQERRRIKDGTDDLAMGVQDEATSRHIIAVVDKVEN
jgi:hypothetical protein